MNEPAPHYRHKGRFMVSLNYIQRDPNLVRFVLAHVIVIRAEVLFDKDAVEYIAISPLFEAVAASAETPPYTCIISETGPLNQRTARFERQFANPSPFFAWDLPRPAETVAT